MPVRTIKLSQYNDAIWNCLKLYFPPLTILSCVYRTDQDQLDIVVQRVTKKGYKFRKPPTVSDPQTWTAAWQLVNTKTDPVAPPGNSTHRLGIAYDLAGPNLNDIVAGIQKASSSKVITQWSTELPRPIESRPAIPGPLAS